MVSRSAVLVLSLWRNGKCQNGGEPSCRVSGSLCCGFHKQGGGVVDIWRRIEQPGRKSEALLQCTVNSTRIMLRHILVRCRSTGLQQGSPRDIWGSLCEVQTQIWLMHIFSEVIQTLLGKIHTQCFCKITLFNAAHMQYINAGSTYVYVSVLRSWSQD